MSCNNNTTKAPDDSDSSVEFVDAVSAGSSVLVAPPSPQPPQVSAEPSTSYPLNGSFLLQGRLEIAQRKKPQGDSSKPYEAPSFSRVFVRGFARNASAPERKSAVREVLKGSIYLPNGPKSLIRAIKASNLRRHRASASIEFGHRLQSGDFAMLTNLFGKRGLKVVVDQSKDYNEKLDRRNAAHQEQQENAAKNAFKKMKKSEKRAEAVANKMNNV